MATDTYRGEHRRVKLPYEIEASSGQADGDNCSRLWSNRRSKSTMPVTGFKGPSFYLPWFSDYLTVCSAKDYKWISKRSQIEGL